MDWLLLGLIEWRRNDIEFNSNLILVIENIDFVASGY